MKKSVGGTDTIVEVGSGSGIAASFTAYEYTATSNQTTFSGADNNSNTLAYNTGTPPAVQVFMNGILLDEGSSQDYTGTNGTSIVLTSAADAGDLVQIHAYKSDVSIVSNLNFIDNQKLQFGDSQDLQIYHDGTQSIIQDVGTGQLKILGENTIHIGSATNNHSYIRALKSGAVELYHNNVKKFETTTTGADVSGNMNVSGSVFFNSDLRANNVSNKLILKADSSNLLTELHSAGSGGIVFKDSGNGQIASLSTGGNLALDGLLSAEDNIYLTDAGTVRAKLLLNSSDRDNVELRAESIGSTMKFFTAATEALELAADQKASFKGSIVLNSNGKVVEISDAAIQWYSYPDSAYKQARFRATDYEFKNGGNTPVMTISSGGNLSATGNLSVGGNTTITGNLTVNGTTTTINSTELSIDDKNIIIAQGTSTSADADGAGITINGPTNNASLFWDHSNQYMEFNKDVFTPSGFIIGTTGTKVGRMYNSAGVMALEAYTSRQISFGNATNGEHVRITADGDVGIGTNAPSGLLSLEKGTRTLDVKLETSPASGDVGVQFRAGASDYLGLAAGGGSGTGIVIDDSNKVGIGTASPSQPLTVAGVDSIGIDDYVLHNGDGDTKFGFNAVDSFKVRTGGGDRFIVNNNDSYFNNQVGIGTTSPSYKLHIKETGVNGGAIFVEDGTSWLRVVPNLGGSGFNPMSVAGDIGLIFSNDNDSSTDSSTLGLLIAPHSTSAGGIKILEDGRVGIGTTTPNSRFTVNTTTTGDGIELQSSEVSIAKLSRAVDGSTVVASLDGVTGRPIHIGGVVNEKVILANAGGNVGIGVSTPTEKLHIASSAADHLTLKLEQDNASYESWFEANSQDGGYFRAGISTNSANYAFFNTDQASYRWFGAGTSTAMTFTNGNLGIGTTNPQTPLHVEGITRITENSQTAFYGGDYVRVFGNQYYDFRNSGGSTKARIHVNGSSFFNGGKVGIGTSSPLDLLHLKSSTTDARAVIDGHTGFDAELKFAENGTVVYTIGHDAATDNFVIGTTNVDTQQRLVIDSSGNVGIGTNAPDTNLEVDIKNGADGNGIHITSTSTTNDPTLKLTRNGGSADRFQFMIRGGAGSARLGISAGTNLDSGLNLGSNNGLSIGTTTAAGSGGLLVDNDIKSNSRFGVGSGGSLSDAAIYKNSDTNTGIYWPGTDQIALTTAGSNRLHISSNGGVSLNSQNQLTTGGNARLSIIDSTVQLSMGASNSDMSYIRRQGAGQFAWQTYNSGNSGILQLQPYGGNVTINTTAAVSGHALSVSGKIGGLTYSDSYLQFTGGNAILKANDDVAIGYTSSLYVKQSGKVGVGTSNPKAEFQVDHAGIDAYSVNTSATSAAQVDTFSATDFRSARFTVQITNTTDSTYQITEILLIHDGTTPSMTEYGTIFTGSAREASFDADIVSGNVRLLATPASTDSMQFKVVRHSILV